MKVLVTGHKGYIGSVLVPMLQTAELDVVGLDSALFGDCTFGDVPPDGPALTIDVRDVGESELSGFDAVIHLAALSNDPLGDVNPACTYAINHRASVRLAELAKCAGVPRFLFASSCSLYGVAGQQRPREGAPLHLITPDGECRSPSATRTSQLARAPFRPHLVRTAPPH